MSRTPVTIRRAASQRMIDRESYDRSLSSCPVLPQTEIVALVQAAQTGDTEARNRVITSNLKLVRTLAKKYIGRGLSLSDLTQEGSIGLLRAVEKFDVSRDVQFSTYASHWIKQAIRRAIREQGKLVQIPSYVYDLISQFRKAEATYERQNGFTPSTDTVLSGMDLSPSLAENLRSALLLLSGCAGEDAIAETMVLKHPEDSVENADLSSIVADLIATLPTREREVIEGRFSCDMTLKEIGEILGLTRERIRQIEKIALATLRGRLEPQTV